MSFQLDTLEDFTSFCRDTGRQTQPMPVTCYIPNLHQHSWFNQPECCFGVGQRLDGGYALVATFGQFIPASLGIDLRFREPVFQNIGSRVVAIGSCSFDVDRYACIGAGYINGIVSSLPVTGSRSYRSGAVGQIHPLGGTGFGAGGPFLLAGSTLLCCSH